MGEKVLHFLGEVEVIFGLWAFIFLALLASLLGMPASIDYLNAIDFKETVFIFIIMCMSATKPVMVLADKIINFIARTSAKIFFIAPKISLFNTIFIFGTLLGSLVTEPVAMTLSSLLLKEHFFSKTNNTKFKYAMLGLLFVNISVGGTLTHFAAPPVLIVAATWNWNATFMLLNFGIKSILCVIIGTVLTSLYFRKEIIATAENERDIIIKRKIPAWIILINVFFLIFCVIYHSYIVFLVPLFLLFIGWFEVTKEYQNSLKIRESLLVGFFLGGIVTLGTLQQWWLIPLIKHFNAETLFLSTTVLTSFTDNAALTYLGTLIPDLSYPLKYALVAGAVTGGGLTVIANAPNPIGYGILNKQYGEAGISPLYLFLAALPYTILAIIIFL